MYLGDSVRAVDEMACDFCTATGLQKLWAGLGADGHGYRAAGAKAATAGRVDGAGYIPLDPDAVIARNTRRLRNCNR